MMRNLSSDDAATPNELVSLGPASESRGINRLQPLVYNVPLQPYQTILVLPNQTQN